MTQTGYMKPTAFPVAHGVIQRVFEVRIASDGVPAAAPTGGVVIL